MKKKTLVIILAVVLAVALLAGAAGFALGKRGKTPDTPNTPDTPDEPQTAQTDPFHHDDLPNAVDFGIDDGYELTQMLVISRHNIRSPLSDKSSILGQITPHEWFAWTSNSGELSVKGGNLETAMGQFFRKYLESKALIPENWQPEEGEVRFYANSLQRTVATSTFFAAGLLPVADVSIEYHNALGTVDPLFCPIIRCLTPAFEEQVRAEIDAWGDGEGLVGIGKKLKESFELLEKVIDFKDSDYAKENGLEHIPTDDIRIVLAEGAEVSMSGGLRTVCSAVDALKLQLYEEPDLAKALFGHDVTEEELKKICESGDVYQDICEGSKTLATQVMGPMIAEMKSELMTEGRKFSYLCGHDSTLTALVSALGIKEYELPGSVSCKAPIGAKMVLEKYRGADGKDYVRLNMCYDTTEQLRNGRSLSEPPMFYGLELEGLQKKRRRLLRLRRRPRPLRRRDRPFRRLRRRTDRGVTNNSRIPHLTREKECAILSK